MSKHKTIIMGRICRKKYDADVYIGNVIKFREYTPTIENKQIWSGELDYIADAKEQIYIEELDITAGITKVLKTTNGIIYHTDYIIEVIEDDVSIESKIEADKRYKMLKQRERKYESKSNKGVKFFERFFNFLFNKPID